MFQQLLRKQELTSSKEGSRAVAHKEHSLGTSSVQLGPSEITEMDYISPFENKLFT